ncbi:uncharacterized protein LOC115878596 [Sitophilus oryzae]|uniref:Uncharacterized protein LOC115878596 n=1 Tax=Sitophilus oryzae TaxID=7048 RepID=A0A6J2XIS3_SITOR|nr:uncharacterized protein LOC115878596 [Sitophilus oryzae]
MGNCCVNCWPTCGKTGPLCNFSMLSKSNTDFTFLIEEESACGATETRSFFTRLLERHKKKQKKQNTSMVENMLNPNHSYSRLSERQRALSQGSFNNRDIQLQSLDAGALLGRTNTSTPENSLDLEWEHETLPVSLVHDPSASSWGTSLFREDTLASQANTSPNHNEGVGNTSESDWSRVSSSANSLEWDSVQNSAQSDVDTLDIDTQFLLNEIDRLTNQALKETGTLPDSVSYLDDTV